MQSDVSVCCSHTAREPQEQVSQKSVTTCADWHLHMQMLKVEEKSDANMSRSRGHHAKMKREHDPRVLGGCRGIQSGVSGYT